MKPFDCTEQVLLAVIVVGLLFILFKCLYRREKLEGANIDNTGLVRNLNYEYPIATFFFKCNDKIFEKHMEAADNAKIALVRNMGKGDNKKQLVNPYKRFRNPIRKALSRFKKVCPDDRNKNAAIKDITKFLNQFDKQFLG